MPDPTPAWRLVPVEPTLKQMAAVGPPIRASVGLDGKNGTVVDVYRAAIDAAIAAQPNATDAKE